MTWKGVNGVKNVKLICKKLNIIVAKNKVKFIKIIGKVLNRRFQQEFNAKCKNNH